MATVRTGEYSSYRNNLVDEHASMKVWLWDCGPEEPELPEPPDPPHGKQGDPRFDLANIKFQRALKAYKDALEKYERDAADFKQWARSNGGPIELLFWSTDARDALQNDHRAVAEGHQARPRWHLSARTRGYERLENRGLPVGMNPGHGHQANIERQIAGEKEFLAAMKADPVFGEQ